MTSAGPVYVIDGNRTPFLKAGSKPGPFSAADLAVATGRALLARQPFSPEDLSEVILGCVIPSPDEVNIARVVSQRLGCGVKVPAWTVQRNCGSGMQALETAADRIRDGHSSLVLAGGVEAMSHAPVQLNNEMVGWLGAWNRAKSKREKLRLLAGLRNLCYATIDYNMPGLNGMDVAAIVKERHPETHIALLTANVQAALRKRAADLGIGFIDKPINEAKITAFITSAGAGS